MSDTNLVVIKRFEALTGYTEKAINAKIDEGIWTHDKEWHRAPDGRRIIDIAGYERWVLRVDLAQKKVAKGIGQ